MKEKSSSRKSYIDIAKGLGIFSVVLVHFTVYGSFLSKYILPYCVSVFFIISGLLFSESKSADKFIKSIVNKMIVPFLVYQIIDMVYTLIVYFIGNYSNLSTTEVVKIIAKVTFVSGSANSNGPLWFLPALIYTEIIVYLFCRLKNKYILYGLFASMFIIGFFSIPRLPFRIQQIPSSVVLFLLGFFSKKLIDAITKSKYKVLICLSSIALYLLLVWLNGMSELAALNFGRIYIVFFIEDYFAAIGILTFSMLINKNSIIEFYGKNSMTVMCCHYIIARRFAVWLFTELGLANLLESQIVEIILAILLIAIMYPVCLFVNRYIRILVGQVEIKSVNTFIDKLFVKKINS